MSTLLLCKEEGTGLPVCNLYLQHHQLIEENDVNHCIMNNEKDTIDKTMYEFKQGAPFEIVKIEMPYKEHINKNSCHWITVFLKFN